MKLGRIVRVLNDNSRRETFSNNSEDRKVVISIFYPADEEWDTGESAYYKDLYEPIKEEFIKRFADDDPEKKIHLNNLKINAYNNAPIIKEDRKYPIIIFSPGLGDGRDFYMYNIEKMVSNGYIVLTVGHIYDSDFTVLPDGVIIEQAESISNFTMENKQLINELINIRKKDILFVLDQLYILNNKDEIMKNKMDLSKIGAVGHSMGAYSLFESFNEDERIKTLIMLDGSLQCINLEKDILLGKRLNKPLLNFRKGIIEYDERMKFFIEKYKEKLDGESFKKCIIEEHDAISKQEDGQRQLYKYLNGYKSFIKLEKTEHMTFSDWFVVKSHLQDRKMLPIKKAHDIINSVTIAFLNQFLCEKNQEYTELIHNNIYNELKILNINEI